MSQRSDTPKLRRIAKLERALIKSALVRFAEWRKKHGAIKPGDFVGREKTLAHLQATEALYEATHGR